MQIRGHRIDFKAEAILLGQAILWAVFILGGALFFLYVTNYVYEILPSTISSENAIQVLNDTVTFNGVLLGFSSVIAGLNITEIYRIQNKTVFLDREELAAETQEVRDRRFNIAYDFMVIGILSFIVFNALLTLAQLPSQVVPKIQVSSNIDDTMLGLLAISFRLYRMGIGRWRTRKRIRIQFPE